MRQWFLAQLADKWWYIVFWLAMLVAARVWLVNPILEALRHR